MKMEFSTESITQLLAIFTFLFGLIFFFFSLQEDKREHSLRIGSVLILTTIALVANDMWTYFATVFIIATAVTKLDFLQNLAAIIRGDNEHYFGYKIRTLTQEEVIESKKEDLESSEYSTLENSIDEISNPGISKSHDFIRGVGQSLNEMLYIHDLYFQFVGNKWKNIWRNQEITDPLGGYKYEFDAIAVAGNKEIVIEASSQSKSDLTGRKLMEKVKNFVKKGNDYSKLSHRKVRMLFAILTQNEIPDNTKRALRNSIQKLSGLIQVEFHTWGQIGYEEFQPPEKSAK
ncbi:MAG: hypothetical protein RJQ09_04540 [Cyclobacteriaceae bacterium]